MADGDVAEPQDVLMERRVVYQGPALSYEVKNVLPATTYHFRVQVSQAFLGQILTHYRPAMPFGNRKKEDLFRSVLSQFKKYHPPGNLKLNY